MSILQVQNISLSFGPRVLLDNVSFTLGERARCALAGGNGEGKSTLMKVVAGLMEKDNGEVTCTRGMKIAYLPQSDIVLRDSLVFDEIAADIDKELVENGYLRTEAVVYRIAMGLGFTKDDLKRKCSEFSGGYQMRIALARVLAKDPDLMMLDEPTNYLDIEARLWLKDFLKNYRGSLLIVCHDKGFLDDCVNEVYELFHSKLTRYSGNYSFYEKQRQLELEQLEAAYKKQQGEIEKTEQFIERFRYKATKAKQVQSRIKALDKIELIEVPSHLKKLCFSFPQPPHSPNDMVIIENLSKHYSPEIKPFTDFSMTVTKGQRLAVTGHNGIGKSTLLRIIAQQDKEFKGSCRLGSAVKTGYFSQDTADSLNFSNTVIEEVLPYGSENQMRNALGSFLFSGDDILKKISVLSGGERSRLALLKILLQPANLLILDEPTNHLDINAKDMLLKALEDYEGTIIFVSHDAYFIKALATSILYLSEEKPMLINGDYDYFEYTLMKKFNSESSQTIGQSPKNQPAITDRAQANKLRNQNRKLQLEIEGLLQRIQLLEEEIAEMKEKMNDPQIYSDQAKISALVTDLQEKQNLKDDLETQWMEKTELLENAQL